MSRAKERTAHAGCLTVGLVVFVGFFAEGATLYDTYTDTQVYAVQQQALRSYIALVEMFVQVWLVLLLTMTVTWVYQRFVLFRKLKAEWESGLAEAEKTLVNLHCVVKFAGNSFECFTGPFVFVLW